MSRGFFVTPAPPTHSRAPSLSPIFPPPPPFWVFFRRSLPSPPTPPPPPPPPRVSAPPGGRAGGGGGEREGSGCGKASGGSVVRGSELWSCSVSIFKKKQHRHIFEN